MLNNFLNSFQYSRPNSFISKNLFHVLICYLLIISMNGCSSSRRFNDDNNFSTSPNFNSPNIDVLLDDKPFSQSFNFASTVVLYSSEKRIAIINKGNNIEVNIDGGKVIINIGEKSFKSEYFKIEIKEKATYIKYNKKNYRGAIKLLSDGSNLVIVNELPLEEYLKGVLPLEMPIGKADENVEALKAMAVAARTYSLSKMNKNNSYFDVYLDVRDQVYGGLEAEKKLTNKIIDLTQGQVLNYNDKPAQVFYSAACGGYTEDSKNVFGNYDIPYLRGVKDGEEPYCSIMPGFEWTEKYTDEEFLSILKNAGKINNLNYSIEEIEIDSRFNSGRVNELKINLESDENDDKEIILNGNRIRSTIKRANGRILKSTMFDIELNGDEIVISGRGNGHGVGLCQWGTIYLSHEGTDYKEILSHYFPGTDLKQISYDK